ncbi:TIGR01456 family HAD hydrolase [Lichtheimia ornata]|uniref:TIGR01456 family HAD hydrolase n=1 Tax=Lichtheimia ornata TaxID=688661 RepID=A0AAD7UVN8_9FUNG|nr:TIGR01456 family HAD hydrolase [Lichtheimia ornata]KAJ8654429.1 TIGR01456 family HAD hydrolase [Lichtheimia ornata]
MFSLNRLCTRATRSFSTIAPRQQGNAADYAFAFDIDGVLVKGKRTIPQAKKALQMLNGDNPSGRRVPFVLLTNGGGVTEAIKAAQVSEMLDLEIQPEQVILSHSPMQALVPQYKDKAVLVVGGQDRAAYEVAKQYGFDNVVIPDDIHCWQPPVWPFRSADRDSANKEDVPDFSKTPISAVMMFHDSRDWGRDIQIMLDVICSQGGVVGTQKTDFAIQDIPVYFSNNDVVWSTEFPVPRLGQGSFKAAIEHVYYTLTGEQLQSTSYGKPHSTTYAYAERVLESLQGSKPKRVYAIGDNPAADIKGASDYGWSSVLVRTGVFRGPGNSTLYPANAVVDHVEHAVEWVLSQEGDL